VLVDGLAYIGGEDATDVAFAAIVEGNAEGDADEEGFDQVTGRHTAGRAEREMAYGRAGRARLARAES
jgi:hypothetical protein